MVNSEPSQNRPSVDPVAPRTERSLIARIMFTIMWFLPCVIVINMLVGGIVGGFTSTGTATNFKEGYEVGHNSSLAFFQQYGRIVFFVELVIWLALSFKGILPGTAKFKKAKIVGLTLFLLLIACCGPSFADTAGCQQAHDVCREACLKPKASLNLPENFPDLCAAACAEGVPPCAEAIDKADKCHQFLWRCQDACPDVQHDRAGNVYTETRTGRACLNSCYDGDLRCFDVLKPGNPAN